MLRTNRRLRISEKRICEDGSVSIAHKAILLKQILTMNEILSFFITCFALIVVSMNTQFIIYVLGKVYAVNVVPLS